MTNQRRISEYTKQELGDMTNQEIKALVEYELTFNVHDSFTIEREKDLKGIISDIESGTYLNPYKKESGGFLKGLVFMFGVYVVGMNLGVGHYVPTIPILSDITPMVSLVKPAIGDSQLKVLSHSDFNEINPHFCNKLGNTGYCVRPIFR